MNFMCEDESGTYSTSNKLTIPPISTDLPLSNV